MNKLTVAGAIVVTVVVQVLLCIFAAGYYAGKHFVHKEYPSYPR